MSVCEIKLSRSGAFLILDGLEYGIEIGGVCMSNRTNSPYAGSAAHALLVKETGQKGWIPTPTSKPVPAHHAGTVPTPIDYGVGEYLFQTVDRGF